MAKAVKEAVTPEAGAALKAAVEQQAQTPLVTPEKMQLLRMFALNHNPAKSWRDSIAGLAVAKELEPLMQPGNEAQFDAFMLDLTSGLPERNWNPKTQGFEAVNAPAEERILAAASKMKVDSGVVPTTEGLRTAQARDLATGATMEEAQATTVAKVENAAHNQNVNPLGRTQKVADQIEKVNALKVQKIETEAAIAQAQQKGTDAIASARAAAEILFGSKKQPFMADPKADAEAAADATKVLISSLVDAVMAKIKELFLRHTSLRVDRALVEQLRNEVFREILPPLDPNAPPMTAEAIEEMLEGFGFNTDAAFTRVTQEMKTEGLKSSDKGKTITITDADRIKGNWSSNFLKKYAGAQKAQIETAPLSEDGTKEVRANVDRKLVKDLSEQDYFSAKRVVIARDTAPGVPRELLTEGLMLDQLDSNYTFLINELSQNMSLYEAPAQMNAVIDGVNQFNNLFRMDASGEFGVDTYISNSQRRQGLTMKDSAALQTELISTLYNWMHEPHYWFKGADERVDLSSAVFMGPDGAVLSGEARAKIKAKLADSMKIASDDFMRKKKGKMDGKLPRGEFSNTLASVLKLTNPGVTFSLKPGELLLPLERAARLTKAFKTTIRNHTKAEMTPAQLKDANDNPIHFVAEVETRTEVLDAQKSLEKLKQEEEFHNGLFDKMEKESLPPEMRPQERSVPEERVSNYPESVESMLKLLRETEPNEVYSVSKKPVKKTTTKKLFLAHLKATPGVTKERLAELDADPTRLPGVTVDGDKVTFYEWTILKAKNPNLLSVDSLVEGIDSAVGKSAPADFVYDADVKKGIEILNGLKTGEFVDPEKDILLISDLMKQAITGDLDKVQRNMLFDALLQNSDEVALATLKKLKVAPELSENLIATYKSLKELQEIAKISSAEFFSDGLKLNLVGESVAQMMDSWGIGPMETTVILQNATPEIKYALLNAVQNNGSLQKFRQDLGVTTQNVRQQIRKSRVRVVDFEVREAMTSLADLVAGRRTEPVEFGGIIISNFDYQTPYRKYILSGKTEPYRVGEKQPSKFPPLSEGKLGEPGDLNINLSSTTPIRAALSGEISHIDKIVTPEVLAEHIFDELGIPIEYRETYPRDFAALLELSRVEDVGFGTLVDDINGGILGGALSNKREIYLSSLKELAMKDRVKAQHFVLAHELGHLIEADARAGRYGGIAQEAFAKADGWIRDADTQTLADAMDVLYNGLLPKEFQNEASLAVSKNLSPEEFFANASAFHRLSLLKNGNEMVNTLLPTPIRSAFDWLVGHFHKLTRV